MKRKSILSLILAAVLCFGMAACKKEESSGGVEEGGSKLTAIDPATEPVDKYPTNVLHKVSVQETSNPFVSQVDGVASTEYQIVSGGGDLTQKATSFVQGHLARATGAILNVSRAEDVEYSAEGKYIYFNCPTQFAAAGLTMPTEDIGPSGYYIKTVGNGVFVATKAETGAQQAAIALLRHLVGYEMFAVDCVSYSKNGATMPNMDIVERPDYDFYVASNKIDADTMYGMGFQNSLDVFINVTSEASSYGPWHNSLDYLPEKDYGEEHSDWYSDVAYGDQFLHDLCYTAHGNATELEAMVTEVARIMVDYAERFPNIPTIAFTIEDHNTVCSCSACTTHARQYNNSYAAAVIQFLNRVNEKVQSTLAANAQQQNKAKRDLNILFFAYHKMLTPPAKKNAQGVWTPIDDTVVCAKEVGVYLAPIEANYGYSFNDEINAIYKDNCDGWAACADLMYIWTYNTNFHYYMYPCNSFDSMIENYRYFKEMGAVYMWSQGQHNQNNASHFSNFKDYVNSQALFDVRANMKDLTDKYFANYFQDAAQPMRQYYDELQAHLTYLLYTNPTAFNRVTHAEIATISFWPQQLLVQWLGYIDQAYQAIEKYQISNPTLYEALEKRIKIESIFLRYAQITLYSGSYPSQLDEMRIAFKNDCEELGITQKAEWDTLASTDFIQWGLV